jgi:glutathione synthase
MKLAFILDPLDHLKAYKDSSVAMMRAAQARGHESFAVMRPALAWRAGAVVAQAERLTVRADHRDWFEAEAPQEMALADFDAVLMRQDPPFDFEYLAATWLLERAQAGGARVFNDPRAVRDHSEKLAILEFPQFTPETLVAREPEALQAFIEAAGDAILKPLDGMGGSQVFRVARDDPNRNVIVETLTGHGARSIMAQRYLPEIAQGDKRILLIGGEPVPFALARIPKAGETRGNLAAGGSGVAQPLSARDREIAEHLAPILARARHPARRHRRHRRLPDRDQRHQPDLLRRDRAADRLRRRRPVHRCPGAGMRRLRAALAPRGTAAVGGCARAPQLHQREAYVFGTRVEVSVWGESADRAQQALAAVLAEFDRLHRMLHAWQPSELTALNGAIARGERDIAVSPELTFLLEDAAAIAARSDHLFNPAIGRLVALWGFHSDEFKPLLPEAAAVEAVVKAQPRMSDLSFAGERVSSRNRAVQLDLGGYAKGYALDRAAAILRGRA